MPPSDAVLSIGSNMGDRESALQGAVDSLALSADIEVTAVSDVFETDPVGGPDQDDYLNAVVLARTSLSPQQLLIVTQRIESEWLRTREVHWGPRTLDIDIIAMGDVAVDQHDLVIPHPRAHERAFVLVPWSSVDSGAVIPGRGLVADLCDQADTSGVRLTSLHLEVPGAARRQP